MIINLTDEQVQRYTDALERAIDCPFIQADEELYELVTLELKQRNFIRKYSVKFDTEFNFF